MDEQSSGRGIFNNGFGPNRRSTIRLILSIAVALAIAIALYVFQPSWFSAPVVATDSANQATPTPSPTPKPKPASYPYLGETRKIDGIAITPLDVYYTRGSSANPARAHDTYVIVTLRIVNERNQDYSFNPNVNCLQLCYFYVQDSQGEKNPPVPYDPLHTSLRALVLQPGGHQEGSYTFEVPERDAQAQTLQLLWYHDPLTDANSIQHWYLRRRER